MRLDKNNEKKKVQERKQVYRLIPNKVSENNGRSTSAAPADPNAPAPNQPAPADPADLTMPALNQPALAASQIVHQPALNWSHFKPEFSGRPEEDVEAHLLLQMTGWKPTIFKKV